MDVGGLAMVHQTPPAMAAGGVGHYPVRMVMEDRLAGVGDMSIKPGIHPGGAGLGVQVQPPPPTQILHSILSMKASRHDLGSQSPPGHGYMLPVDTYSTWGPPPQYPTPPSSHSSSPGPQVFPPSPPQPSPQSPDNMYGDDLPGSPSTSQPHMSAWDDDSRRGDQPMDLKKRRRSSDFGSSLSASGEEPMDLSCPKKLRLSQSYCPMASPSSCCPSTGRRSPYTSGSESTSRRSPPAAAAASAASAAGGRSHSHCTRRPSHSHTNKKLVYDPSDAPSNESILKSILCGHLKSRSTSPTQGKDGDGTSSTPFMYSLSSSHGLTRSPQQRVSDLLEKARRLQQQQQQQQQQRLQQQQQHQQQQHQQQNTLHNHPTKGTSFPPSSVAGSDHSQALPVANGSERLTCPTSTSPVVATLPRHTEVSLAKKNLLPVSARVSEWLLKAVGFAKALPEFQVLPKDDQMSLILSAWSRLLLLQMAETNFEFAVNPCPVATPAASSTPPNQPSANIAADRGQGASGSVPGCNRSRPTVEAVEGIESFLRKCQTLEMTKEEITLLKLLSLFNPSYQSMGSSPYIEKVNTHIRKCLQDACAALPGRGKLRYSQLLLVLPPLFGVRPKVVEALFCQHITVNTDMELLLKDMLHKL